MSTNAFFNFESVTLPPETEALRREARSFLKENLPEREASERGRTWGGFDPQFTKKMAQQGWIGMTWPKRYGGHERTALERYVVLEEMLVADAPVGGHWIGDRQSGPLLLNFGTEEQRQFYLPRIASGEIYLCIGMSEPDSGSDLASVRTKAEKCDGGYRVNGRKLWTSNAHQSHYMIGLFRTHTDSENRHAGLSQFLVDLSLPGISIRPIPDMLGQSHFNEVTFDDVHLPEEALVGKEGAGWDQVNAELAFERSGPERYLSSYLLLVEAIRLIGKTPTQMQKQAVGRLVAHMMTLRRMSLSIAGMLHDGQDPRREASVVKDLGTAFEQELPRIVQSMIELEPTLATHDRYTELLSYFTQISPAFSLRGGTREILRGMIARSLGLR